jgi:hypothetical protein
MGRLRLCLRVLGLAAVLGAISITPVLAQSATTAPAQTLATCDGQTFAGQSVATQQQFIGAYGANAANVWAQQHNAAVMAAGACPPPVPPVAAVPPPAPIVVVQENGNGNSNSNDNDDRQPTVSLDLSKNDVNRGESFEIRVSGHREGDVGVTRIWWWATDTSDSNLSDRHTHECGDVADCRQDWQESTNDGGKTIRIHAQARNRDGRDSEEVTKDVRVR